MRTLPDKISTLELPNGPVQIDEAGFITNPEAWSRIFAEHVAADEDIELTPLHWQIIDFMRQSYSDHGVAVDVRHVLKMLQNQRGLNKHDVKMLLFELFPYGYVKQAVKMSGMKQPRAWSTG
ncbi:MAG: TusE/DsrC/DsvC family sulfur relay protein [Rhodobacteraceae bacterium]|nr:TusE/DsrC/DsvC family sulfur relay protein [Paracoccaceae bacterium]